MAIAFFIPLAQSISAVLIIILFLFSFVQPQPERLLRYFTQGWDAYLYFAMLMIGMLYSADKENGARVIETSLTILVFPIAMSRIIDLDRNKLYGLFLSFASGTLLAGILCILVATTHYYQSGSLTAFTPDRLTEALENTHPVYFAYYLIFSITFGLYLLYYEPNFIPQFALIGLLVVLFGLLMLMGNGTAVLSVLFSFLYFILKFIFDEGKSSTRLTAMLLALIFLICLFALSGINKFGMGMQNDDYWERYILWESAMNAMPDAWTGVGTGGYTNLLNEYYRSHDLQQFAEANFNPHNQYIDAWFSWGILGLLVLLTLIVRPMYMAIMHESTLGFLSLFPFLIYGMTEVFLGRYQGVVFFIFLHQAFVLLYTQQNKSFSIKET